MPCQAKRSRCCGACLRSAVALPVLGGIVLALAVSLPAMLYLPKGIYIIYGIGWLLGAAMILPRIEDRRHPEETQAFYARHLDRKGEDDFAESIRSIKSSKSLDIGISEHHTEHSMLKMRLYSYHAVVRVFV